MESRGTLIQPGTVVAARYRVSALLGRGGMGAVYAARQLGLERDVAIKVMLGAFDEQRQQRFVREARAVGKLQHRNVITVHDFGVDAGLPYMAMELLRGESLGHRLSRLTRLSVQETRTLLADVASGLSAAHAADVLHRDLKPDNIFLAKRTDGVAAVLLDFGLARSIEGDTEPSLTQAGLVVGTPGFIAPEVIGGEPASPVADAYAVGVVGFLALTGRMPFAGRTGGKLLVAQLQEASPSVASLRTDLPEALVALIDGLLQREPSERSTLDDALTVLMKTASSDGFDDIAEVAITPATVLSVSHPTEDVSAAVPSPAMTLPPVSADPPRRATGRLAVVLALALAAVSAVALWPEQDKRPPSLQGVPVWSDDAELQRQFEAAVLSFYAGEDDVLRRSIQSIRHRAPKAYWPAMLGLVVREKESFEAIAKEEVTAGDEDKTLLRLLQANHVLPGGDPSLSRDDEMRALVARGEDALFEIVVATTIDPSLIASHPKSRNLLEAAPFIGRTFVNLSIAEAYDGRWDDAARVCRRGIERHPQYATLHACIAWSELAHGRPQEALRRAERATKGRVEEHEGRLVLNMARLELNQVDAVLEDVELIVSGGFPSVHLTSVVEWANHAANQGRGALAQQLYDRAWAALEASGGVAGMRVRIAGYAAMASVALSDAQVFAPIAARTRTFALDPSLSDQDRRRLVFANSHVPAVMAARGGRLEEAEASLQKLKKMEFGNSRSIRRYRANLEEEVAASRGQAAVFEADNDATDPLLAQYGFTNRRTMSDRTVRQVRALRSAGRDADALTLVEAKLADIEECRAQQFHHGENFCQTEHAWLRVFGAEAALALGEHDRARALVTSLSEMWPFADEATPAKVRIRAVAAKLPVLMPDNGVPAAR